MSGQVNEKTMKGVAILLLLFWGFRRWREHVTVEVVSYTWPPKG